MKLVVTVSDAVHVANVGGELDRVSAIIDLGDNIPPILKEYMQKPKPCYLSVSFSILDESTERSANNG